MRLLEARHGLTKPKQEHGPGVGHVPDTVTPGHSRCAGNAKCLAVLLAAGTAMFMFLAKVLHDMDRRPPASLCAGILGDCSVVIDRYRLDHAGRYPASLAEAIAIYAYNSTLRCPLLPDDQEGTGYTYRVPQDDTRIEPIVWDDQPRHDGYYIVLFENGAIFAFNPVPAELPPEYGG